MHFWTGRVVAIVIAFVTHAIFLKQVQKWLNPSYLEMMQASVSPPPPMPWVYHPVLWLPLCFALSIFFVVLCAIMLQRLKLSKSDAWFISFAAFSIALLSQIPASHYLPAKRWVMIGAVVVVTFSFLQYRQHILRWLQKVNPDHAVWGLIAISVTQRLIALYAQPLEFVEGDDPLTYHDNALYILNGGWPNGFFSPGLPFFLAAIYSIFGVHPKVAVLVIIALSALSLFFLYRTVANYYNHFWAGLLSVAVFLLNSQYVAMSNHFWSDNVYMLLLPIALFLFYRMIELIEYIEHTDGRLSFVRLIFVVAGLGVLLAAMTLFRSWTPALVVGFGMALFFERHKQQRLRPFIALMVAASIMIVLVQSYTAFRAHALGQEGYVSSNAGFIFVVGNNPYSQGSFTPHFRTYENEVRAIDPSADLAKLVFHYNLDHPLHFATMLGKKLLLWFWGAPHPKYTGPYYLMPLTLVAYYLRIGWCLLSFAGFWSMTKKRQFLPLFLYLILTSIFGFFFVDHRFVLIGFVLQSIAIGSLLGPMLQRWIGETGSRAGGSAEN